MQIKIIIYTYICYYIYVYLPSGGLSGYLRPAGGPTHPIEDVCDAPLGGLPLGSYFAPFTENKQTSH